MREGTLSLSGQVMELELFRYKKNKDSIGGLLFIDRDFQCYTCEDGKRDVKVFGETCISADRYEILLRDVGGMNKHYHQKFPFHEGMLHLQNVRDFEWIYLHIGNEARHTLGCILVGLGPNFADEIDFKVQHSTTAYMLLYNKLLEAFHKNEQVFITIKDEICQIAR